MIKVFIQNHQSLHSKSTSFEAALTAGNRLQFPLKIRLFHAAIGYQKSRFGDCIALSMWQANKVSMYHRTPADPHPQWLIVCDVLPCDAMLYKKVISTGFHMILWHFYAVLGCQKSRFGDCIAHRTHHITHVSMYHRTPADPHPQWLIVYSV